MKMPEEKVSYSKNPLILFFYRPSKNGNLGTLLRSSDALFVDEVVFSGHSVDIYDPVVITASMGSFFKVPFRYIETKDEFEKYYADLRKNIYHIL